MTNEQSRKSDSRASFSTAERRGAGGDQRDLQGFGSDMVGLGRVESPAAPPQATAPSPAGKGRDRTETQVSALNDPVARIDRAARLRESAAGRVGHLALAFRPQKASAADDRTGQIGPSRRLPARPLERALTSPPHPSRLFPSRVRRAFSSDLKSIARSSRKRHRSTSAPRREPLEASPTHPSCAGSSPSSASRATPR